MLSARPAVVSSAVVHDARRPVQAQSGPVVDFTAPAGDWRGHFSDDDRDAYWAYMAAMSARKPVGASAACAAAVSVAGYLSASVGVFLVCAESSAGDMKTEVVARLLGVVLLAVPMIIAHFRLDKGSRR